MAKIVSFRTPKEKKTFTAEHFLASAYSDILNDNDNGDNDSNED